MTTHTVVTAGLVQAVIAAARRRRPTIGMTFLAPGPPVGPGARTTAPPVRRTVSRTAETR